MNSDEILRRERIGRWRVLRLIGEGGFSWVFEVEDPNSGKRLALKALKPEAAEGEQYRRFWREAKLLAAQDDPHLVQIILLERDEELQLDFYVMELLTGRNLSQLLKADGALPIPRAVEIFLGALQGLSRLHALRKPIIHRDIKPANIQITDDGRTKLLDLGIAGTQRNRGDETIVGDEDVFTTAAEFKGTVKYSSAEQLHILELDTSSDVFSMGLCLFEAIEGRHPYKDQADLPSATYTYQKVLSFYARLEGNRREIPLKFERTPKAIQAVVRKALSLKPQARYRTAGEMREALKRAYDGAGATQHGGRRPEPVQGEGAPPPRRWLPIGAIAAGLLVAAVVGSWWMIDGKPSPVPETVPGTGTGTGVSQGPTPEQQAVHAEVARVVDEVERLRTQVSQGGEDADPVIESRRAGDALWDQKEYAKAHQSYLKAISVGNQVLHNWKDVSDTRGIAERKPAAEQARKIAKQAGADLSAGSDWRGAEDLLNKAQRAESERRSDAAEQYASAKGAYDTAAAAAGRALADATAAERAAQASRARLPGRGDCRALSEPEAKGACEEGAAALANGSAALVAKNAPAAIEQLQEARARFGEALKLVPKPEPVPNRPPTLALEPAGQVALKLGDNLEIRADARDPEGEAVEITYAIEVPGAGRKTASGSTLRFEPDREGDYKIVARARDSGGAVSPPVTIYARVSSQPPDPEKKEKGTPTLKSTLDEYARAIETKDMDTLKSLIKLDRTQEEVYRSLFSRDFALSVSVTPVHEDVRGNQATMRFSQSLHGVDDRGMRLPLNEGVYDAQLLRRPDGWQIQSLQRVN